MLQNIDCIGNLVEEDRGLTKWVSTKYHAKIDQTKVLLIKEKH